MIILSMCCGTAYAGDLDLPHITVFGTATTIVTPDRMVWHITVQNKGGNLQDVAEQHSTIVKSVLKFLRETKVPENEIQTASMEFGENWEYKNESRVKEGYFASTNISFKIEDFHQYEPLWIGLARISHVSVDEIYYDHSKEIDYQNETRQKALLVAREKAITLARTLGSRIGEPLLIEEDIPPQDFLSRSRYSNIVMQENDSSKEEGIAPGKITIRMRIKTAFRLITHEE